MKNQFPGLLVSKKNFWPLQLFNRMISFYTASEQNLLLAQLAQDIKQTQRNIFQPIHLISSGFLQDLWLREQLAEQNGIIANLKTFRPDQFIEWLHFRLSGNQTEEKLSLQQLEWIYFSIMGTAEFLDKFPEIKKYCEEDEVKRFALAGKAIRLLDKYQDFRSELIDQWKENKNQVSEDWQEFLFAKALSIYAAKIPNKSAWTKNLHTLLDSPESKNFLHSQVATLYIFGSFSLSPKFLESIHLLGNFISIHWYRVDIDYSTSQTRITQNWGEGIRETRSVLSEKFQEAKFNKLEPNSSSLPSDRLLQQVQTALTSSQNINFPEEKIAQDNSLEFHACHTQIREVESLYNYLIRILKQNPDLGARDIHVLLPELDSYIAAIRTVFETAPRPLPFRIINKGYSKEESFWSALVQLLEFDAEEFTSVNIMALIESNPIREKFGFENLELLRKMMSVANMARESEGDKTTETRYYSINYGLKRLMFGFLLGKDNFEYLDNEGELIFTVDTVEGQEAYDLFRLIELVEMLEQLVKEKKQSKTLHSWLAWVDELAENFLSPDSQTSRKFQKILQDFGVIADQVEEQIQFETFAFRFIQLLEDMDKHSVEGFGGIVFSELLPGRILPKKVIAMMGMNFGEFPRSSQELSFDKMLEGERRPLDPNPRASDQGVFLEAILAAKSHLYLSFIGKSEKDNKPIPASSVVEELMDWVASEVNLKSEKFLVDHPLHATSSRYNQGSDPKLVNFLIKQAIQVDFGQAASVEEEPLEKINLWQLKSFLKDSFKFYYNQRLGIYYGDQKHQLSDQELFESDNLLNWQLKNEFLHLSDFPEEKQRKKWIAQGTLPLRNVGRAILDRTFSEVEELRKKYQAHSPLSLTSSELTISGIQLSGEITKTADDHLIHLTVSKDRPKYRIDAGLDYLFGLATGEQNRFYYLTIDKSLDWQNKITTDQAKEKLEEIVKLFLAHRKQKFIFSLEIDLMKVLQIGDEEKQIHLARQAIKNHVNQLSQSYVFLSEYTLKDYQMGLFEEDEPIRQFLRNTQVINHIFNPLLS
ncbi:MAG: exodeoxyribonuclease V subunit gamma [Bacteroidota bacterium]